MASIPVNNNLKALTNAVSQVTAAQGSRTPYVSAAYAKQEEALQDSFDMVMNRINSQAGANVDAGVGANVGAKANAGAKANVTTNTKAAAVVDTKSMSAGVTGADSAGKNAVKGTAADEKTSVENAQKANDASNDSSAKQDVSEETQEVQDVSKETKEAQDASKEAQEAVEDAGEKLVNDIAKEMDVTPEEVEEAMEVLGLTAVQLLDPANMKQLLMELSGNDDQLSIVTDAELYGHLKNLLDTVSIALEELQSELGLSEEDLSALLADMAVVQTKPEDAEIPEELLTQPDTPDTEKDVNLEGMQDYVVTVHKDGETVEMKVTVDDASGEKSVQEEVSQTSETQPKHEAKSGNRNTSSEHKGEGDAAGNMMMQTPIEQPTTGEISTQQPVMERFVSTEDIMNQIMEYMKINLKGDIQELELQLHPASLGNVHVQIASKEGMITAQFTAQNEVVKAAIESQLVQLKTQFEEQGIKVDAVEVTVADYRFEQSFSGSEEHPGEKQGSGKKTRRNINLNDIDLDDMPEDMDDSEKIAAEMMARNGGTVDYTA